MTKPGTSAPGDEAAWIVERLTAAGQTLATAESLTGGALCAEVVNVPGASNCLVGGVCTYTCRMKTAVLGVDADLLAARGPVCAQVASQMARGALRVFDSTWALATTGVAGPGPDEWDNPAGLAYVALAHRDRGLVWEERLTLSGERNAVRRGVVAKALGGLRQALAGHGS